MIKACYFDTSALVKRYAAEVGSAWVRAQTTRRPGNVIYASMITQAEVIGALQRKVREGNLNAETERIICSCVRCFR